MMRLLERIKNNKIIKNYIWVFTGQNLGTLFSMLTLIFTLKIISTYDYGSLVIIQTYCLLVSNLFSLRTFNGVIKHITDAEQTDDNIRICQYINTGFLLDLLSGTISIIFGILLLKPIAFLMARSILSLGMLSALAAAIARRRRGFLSGSGKPDLAAMVISRASLAKILAFLASWAPLRYIMFLNWECPDIQQLLKMT